MIFRVLRLCRVLYRVWKVKNILFEVKQVFSPVSLPNGGLADFFGKVIYISFFLLRKSDIFEMLALDMGISISPIKTDFELMRSTALRLMI